MKAVVVFFVHNHKGTIASLKTVTALSDCSFLCLLGDIQIVGGWVGIFLGCCCSPSSSHHAVPVRRGSRSFLQSSNQTILMALIQHDLLRSTLSTAKGLIPSAQQTKKGPLKINL
jgi:hypothetical protein